MTTVTIDYDETFSEYKVYEPDGNVTTTTSEEEAIEKARELYGADIEVRIKELPF